MEDVKVYLQEEGAAAGKRIRAKILAAAGFAAVGGTAWAIAGQRPVGRAVPSITANAAVAMAAFAVGQESLRAVRGGQHDAWNSVAAGSLAGAMLTRAAYGRGYHLLGLVIWGPVCGALHWTNSILQPGAAFKYFLASQGLLDLPKQQQQPQPQQQRPSVIAEVQAPRRVDDVSDAELNRWAEEIKQRELAQLKEVWRQKELRAQQATAAVALGGEQQQQGQQQGTGAKRWWGLFG